MRKILILFAITFSLLLQSVVAKSVEYPECEVGDTIKHMLVEFEKKDKAGMERFIKKRLDKQLLSQFALDEHLEYFMGQARSLEKFELVKIDRSSPYEIYLDFITNRSNVVVRYLVEFNPEPPHGLLGLQRSPYVPFDKLSIDDYELLDEQLTKLADENLFSGNLLIEEQGKVTFSKAYGYAEKNFGVKNTLKTRFNLASITKNFTSLAILQLAQQGKLSLNDKIGKYIPELTQEKREKITIEHLLKHQSGLGHYFFSDKYAATKHSINNIEDYIDIINEEKLSFPPGSAEQYSNSGFELLAIIIQRVSKQSYYDYIDSKIFKPAGMIYAGFIEPTLSQPQVAKNYTNLSPLGPEDGFVRETTYLFPALGSASGGAVATVQDMRAFMNAIESSSLLDEKHQKLYLHGFRDDITTKAIGKSGAGGAPGVSTLYIVNFEKNIKLVILSNYDERLAENIGTHLYKQLSEKYSQ